MAQRFVHPGAACFRRDISFAAGEISGETAAVYLHAFRDMDSAVQWPALDEILAEEPRLKL